MMLPSLWMIQGRRMFAATARKRGRTSSRKTLGEKNGCVLKAMSSVET